MAHPRRTAMKAQKQTAQILETIQVLVAEVGELKAETEKVDRTGEILAAIGKSFAETRDQQDRTLNACAMMAAEIVELKAEVAELKAEIAGLKFTTVTSSPAPTRRTKK